MLRAELTARSTVRALLAVGTKRRVVLLHAHARGGADEAELRRRLFEARRKAVQGRHRAAEKKEPEAPHEEHDGGAPEHAGAA